jgi:hypothetical protein
MLQVLSALCFGCQQGYRLYCIFTHVCCTAWLLGCRTRSVRCTPGARHTGTRGGVVRASGLCLAHPSACLSVRGGGSSAQTGFLKPTLEKNAGLLHLHQDVEMNALLRPQQGAACIILGMHIL